ncbi:MAG: hypothetical protein HZB86_01045 [Deltaproteobacteria bacterium]|nr:hypothetical protein [Deltaproteobacteria bacterium]
METISGKPLTVLAVLLAGVSIAGVFGVAISGGIEVPGRTPRGDVAAEGNGPERAAAEVALARSAEQSGNVADALAHYRAAALLDPRVVDPRSPLFLGPGFEARLKKWVGGQKTGGAQARSDAAYLFRRMYGGCG